MDLGKNNLWIIFSLVASNILAPVVVWNMQQGKIENLKIETESELLELEKGKQVINLYEKLGTLMEKQRQFYDEYGEIIKGKEDEIYFERQRVLAKMSEHDERILEIKKMISSISGKNVESIKGSLPPLPPKILSLELLQETPE